MITQINILPFLFAEAKHSTGFLYSPVAKSFISRTNYQMKPESVPMRFTIEVPDNSEGYRVAVFDERFDVVSIDDDDGNGNVISINEKGETKIFNHGMCEAAYEGYLRSEPCKTAHRQIFTWVPENHFDTFVDMISNKPEKRVDNEADSSLNKMKLLLGMPVNTKLSSPTYPPEPPNKYGDKMLEDYMQAYCSSRPVLPECFELVAKQLIEYGQNNDNSLPGIAAQYNSQIDKADQLKALSIRPYISPQPRPRKRGFLGMGEDSSAIHVQCNCLQECVKNPNNGMCFFKYIAGGKLEPIMKNESCCDKKGLCDFENKIEQLMCELSIKNDYSYFSKFIDTNFAYD